jgi:hypothetical protein
MIKNKRDADNKKEKVARKSVFFCENICGISKKM